MKFPKMDNIVAPLKTAAKFTYAVCFSIGDEIINKSKDLFSFVKENVKKSFKTDYNAGKEGTEKLAKKLSEEIKTAATPFTALANTVKNIYRFSRRAYTQGFVKGTRIIVAEIIVSLKKGKRYLPTFWNILAPLGSLAVLLMVISGIFSMNFALSVSINGEHVAYIENESVYDAAEKLLKQRIVYQNDGGSFKLSPEYKVKLAPKSSLTSETELTNILIKSSINEISEAVGFYVDDKFYGAVVDAGPLREALDAKLQSYKTGASNEKVHFDNSVELVEGYYLNNTIKGSDEMVSLVNSEVAGKVSYFVVSGDTLEGIAGKHSLTYNEIAAMNPDKTGVIYPGDEIIISASVPFLTVNITRQEVYNEYIDFKVNYVTDKRFYTGYSYVSVSGTKGTREITADVTYTNGVETSRTVLSSRVTREPTNRVIVVGGTVPPSSSGIGSSTYIWPVGGYSWISCVMGGYPGHKGLDIAASTGTPIYAVADGTVIVSRSMSTGLGKHIKIDHGNGVVTTYGHASVLYAQVGQVVKQGDVIALVGSTGKSTGPHLHIEFIINGYYYNPQLYIKK